jgi:hypothetical protein
MGEREKRVGLNEAVFREVNERIEELAEKLDLADRRLDLICECGDANCVERVSMTQTEYERVRSDPKQFAVYPGHVYDGIEEVVDHHPGFDVVRKRDSEAAKLAEATDSRS